jgi:hypothetical protein
MVAIAERRPPRSTAPPVAPMLHARIAASVADAAVLFHAAGVAKGLPESHAILVRELSEPAEDLDVLITQDIADGIGAIPCCMLRCPMAELLEYLTGASPAAAVQLAAQYRPGAVVLAVATAGRGITLFILID